MMPILEYMLNSQDRAQYIEVINDALCGSMTNIEALLNKARLCSHSLPESVRRIALDFSIREQHDVLIFRGLPIRSSDIPATPSSIIKAENELVTFNDALHIVTSHLFGDVYTFSSIQHGNIINDVIPIANHGNLAISSGFDNDFGLHTEDAFSDFSGEFLGLLCLRNPNHVPTIVSSMRDARLSTKCQDLLRHDVFGISPNIAHKLRVSIPTVRRSILFGHHDDPYIRINTNYNAAVGLDEKYKHALSELVSALSAAAHKVFLRAGDALYINNRLAPHGRPRYTPTLDGLDRWYRRLYISTDLRKSRHLRPNSESRIIDMSLA